MVATAIDRPYKRSLLLVEFKHGTPGLWTYERLTDYTSPLDSGGHAWISHPTMRVKFPPVVATLAERELEIEAQVEEGFLENVAKWIHSPVFVRVQELQRSDGVPDRLIVRFVGRLARAVRNPRGRAGAVLLLCTSWKEQLKSALGLSANHTCQWQLFGKGCDLNVEDFAEEGTITAIDKQRITITGLADHSDDPFLRYWHLGYVEVDGLRMLTREWVENDPQTFVLIQRPPPRWLNATARVVPGDDKSAEVCDQRYANLERFSGFGHAIPSYHPQLGSPT